MTRLTGMWTALCLALVAGALSLGLVVQYQLFKENRLRQIEAIHALVLDEMREALEMQLVHQQDLKSAARLAARLVSLPSFYELMSSVLVVDRDGRTVIEYTDLSVDKSISSPQALQQWPQGWTALDASPQAPVVTRLLTDDALYLATPLQALRGSASATTVGLLILSRSQPVRPEDFLFGRVSPPLLALALWLGCGLLTAVLGWRLRQTLLHEHAGVDAASRAAMAQDIHRLELAYQALGQMARSRAAGTPAR